MENQEQQPVLSGAGEPLPEVTAAPAAETPVADAEMTDASSANWNPAREKDENAQQDFEVFSVFDEPFNSKRHVLLHLPSDTIENVQSALDARPNIGIDETEQGQEWLNTIRNSEINRPFRGWFNRTTKRKGAKFTQGVKSENGGRLNAGNMSFKDKGEASLTGERAVMRVRALTGMGSVIRVPLWHSGFWIALKAPSEGAILELHRRMAEEKILLGRATYGMALGNMSVHYAGQLMDFALSHVYDSSLHPSIEPSMRSRILDLDIPIIVWAMACIIWPGGFPYARSVLNPEMGEKVIKEKINIGRLLWTDNSALTPWQISHMAKFHGQTMTEDQLSRYRNDFSTNTRRIQLSEGVSITLRHASIDQYLNSGNKWINNIINLVDEAFARPPNDAVRDSYIMDQGKATNMRQYAHMVESINLGNGDTEDDVISNVETIEQLLDTLSSNDEIRDAYFNGVKEFIEDATMAIVAVPVTEDEDRGTMPRFPNLLPLDVLSAFFTLLVQKIPQIQAR